jgi:hypothetical protein
MDRNLHLDKLNFVCPGTYHLKLRALKVFGDRNNIHDWEQWISTPLRVDSIPSNQDSDDAKVWRLHGPFIWLVTDNNKMNEKPFDIL